MKSKFFIVDVFAKRRFTGNPLAVFLGTQAFSSDEMQKIAMEMNYSETTFVSIKRKNGGYPTRIFTPKREIHFAGHPVLGSAYVIQKEILKRQTPTINLDLKSGRIPVLLKYRRKEVSTLWMKQFNPSFGQILDSKSISRVLGIDKSDIDERYPIQEASTGLSFIIVPLKSLGALKRIEVNKDRYYRLIKCTQSKAILAFCPETRDSSNDISARVFAEYYGIPEDPATGSANGALAGYLVKYRYFGKERIDIKVEQGYEVGRPSLIYLKAELRDNKIEILVGGRVLLVANGELV